MALRFKDIAKNNSDLQIIGGKIEKGNGLAPKGFITANAQGIDEATASMTVSEMINSGRSPREIVEKVEKWCPRLNAQTIIGHKKISKIKDKEYYKIIYKFLSADKPKQFVITDVIKGTNAKNLTLGDVQRKVLASMNCMGIISKNRIKFKKNKKDESVKDFFSWNEEIAPCPFYKNDNCSLNWRDAEETNLFKEEYEEESDDG